MERLKRRTDFRAAAQAADRGARASAKAFVLQARARGEDAAVRVGFTVSRHVGDAVERNRVRRRLREMVRLSAASPAPAPFHAGHDYVLIGRRAALQAPFAAMMRDLDAALRRVNAAATAVTATGAGNERSLHRSGLPSRQGRKPQNRSRPRSSSSRRNSRSTSQHTSPE